MITKIKCLIIVCLSVFILTSCGNDEYISDMTYINAEFKNILTGYSVYISSPALDNNDKKEADELVERMRKLHGKAATIKVPSKYRGSHDFYVMGIECALDGMERIVKDNYSFSSRESAISDFTAAAEYMQSGKVYLNK